MKENLRCGGDPPRERSCSVPLTRNGGATEMQSLIPYADGPNVAYGSSAVYHCGTVMGVESVARASGRREEARDSRRS